MRPCRGLLDFIPSDSIMPTTVVVDTSPVFLSRSTGRSSSCQEPKKSVRPKTLIRTKAASSPASPFTGRRREDPVAKSSFAIQPNIKASPEILGNKNIPTTPSESANIPSRLDYYSDNILCEIANSDIPITGII